jgi:hypothetical protein
MLCFGSKKIPSDLRQHFTLLLVPRYVALLDLELGFRAIVAPIKTERLKVAGF